ncbi:MAG TPA: helix-turn-helix transcriptional regulator [Pyrinomonadaceae bacterium]|nr:helix-turn-helix transcriptional regulator [Pyrinomonadaceae bacterium]
MAGSIGEQLRLAREERGIPLRVISDQTRISVRYLEAIESNDYRRLPGGIFNRSFVRAYARCIGYDEKVAIDGYARYMREHGESADDVVTTPYHSKVYTDTPATRSPLLTVVLAIVILAILTLAALAAVHWYQQRAAKVEGEVPAIAGQILSANKNRQASNTKAGSNFGYKAVPQ